MKTLKPGSYLPGETLIHRLDPRTKLFCGLGLISMAMMVRHWPALVLNTIFLIAVMRLARTHLKSICKGIKWLGLIFLLSFIIQSVSVDGEVLLRLGNLAVSREGMVKGGVTFLRLLILYLASTVLTMTTSPTQLAIGLEAILAPANMIGIPVSKIAMLISIAMRFVPTTLEEGDSIRRAQKSRGAPFHSPNPLIRMKSSLALFVPLIVISLQRASDLAAAMESRCFTGQLNLSRSKKLGFGHRDYVAMIVMAAVLILPAIYYGDA